MRCAAGASLVVAEVAGVFGRPAAASTAARSLPGLALAGLRCLALLGLAALGVALLRLRRRSTQ